MTEPFAPFELKMRKAKLPEVAIASFLHYMKVFMSGDKGLIYGQNITPVNNPPDISSLENYIVSGEKALPRLAIIKLNGGLGTSMGMVGAKSLLPAKDGFKFLDLIALQILNWRKETGTKVPLMLMNSDRTQKESLAFLAKYPDLNVGLPLDFVQHRAPRIDAANLTPVDWPKDRDLEWCPPGHGDLYPALLTSGLLDKILQNDFEYAFVSNSDNLSAIPDLRILGWFADKGFPFAMEICRQTNLPRKGGHVARSRDGSLVLREIAQCPPQELDDFQNIDTFGYFNTNNIWLHLPTLKQALLESGGFLPLPMICNHKHVDSRNKETPQVIQLETAIGSAISCFKKAQVVSVDRNRFSPVKTTGDLLILWSDIYVRTKSNCVTFATDQAQSEISVELDPAYFGHVDGLKSRIPYGPPSLKECTSLQVEGDVVFGANIICRGDVRIVAESGTLKITDGALLEGLISN